MSVPGQVYPNREQAWTAALVLAEQQAGQAWVFVHGTRYLVTTTMSPGRYWSFVGIATCKAFLDRIQGRTEETE